ncbi:DNA gyrase inhibitor YacG [Pelagovum pacificum]|uniref:DNA gyrase inhibitor YacG n=1 Tax=Pelagovum pacificum TaxID=2588711 RepID=A0A5C5GFN1_9RHOB|nr:DNA gyrase inhibitor YacG [Pelagovum pacificum]QQA43984.1 DNA gyrase inhibitor YacG [Pelagovum pacificum]TNY32887.1 DNA gyrase inhibitor YacG [Pelagovum pacificum]
MSCPICGKVTDEKVRPFCSKRCADIDLAKWLGGDYRLPGEPATEEDFDEAEREERRNLPH